MSKKITNCKVCNAEIASNAKVCPSCGAKNKKPLFKKPIFWIAVVVILFIAIGSASSSSEEPVNASTSQSSVQDNTKKNETTEAKTTVEQTTENLEEFKTKCISYKYSDIARQPSNYTGKPMKFTGKIIQVQEPTVFSKETIYRIDVTKDEYGFYDDTVYVTYVVPDGAPKFLEEDIVTFYGVCKGEMTYTTVMGASVTIPEVEAKDMVLVQGK